MLDYGNRVTELFGAEEEAGNRIILLPSTSKSLEVNAVTGNRIHSYAREDEKSRYLLLAAEAAAKAGYPDLKPEQQKSIVALLECRDVLAVLATGAGKSLAAQVVSMLRNVVEFGLTLCVGPLNALAEDQRRRAVELGLNVRVWNSTVSDGYKNETLALIEQNGVDILFTTAESLQRADLQQALLGRVGLAWIDESHTSIKDGNFRPAQARIGRILDQVRPRVRYACTATIEMCLEPALIARCGLREPLIIRKSVQRQNLRFHHAQRDAYSLCEILRRHQPGRSLVYLATVRGVDSLAAELCAAGFKAAAFHSALKKSAKAEVLARFQAGEIDTVICTDAFGLGIDIPDIRAVVQYDPGSDVADMFQKAGRAGRDGKESDIYLCSKLAREGWRTREFLLMTSFPPIDDLRAVWEFLKRNGPHGVTDSQPQIASDAGVRNTKFLAGPIFRTLKRRGLVQVSEKENAHTYTAAGNFDALDWPQYHAERERTQRRFAELAELYAAPEEEIATRVGEYFGEGGECENFMRVD